MSLSDTVKQLLTDDAFTPIEERDRGLRQVAIPSIPFSCKLGLWLSPLFLLLFDYFTVSMGLLISIWVRNFLIRDSHLFIQQLKSYINIIIPMIYISFMAFEGLYNKRLPLWQKIEKLFKISLFTTLLTAGIFFFTHNPNHLPGMFLGLSALICLTLLLIEQYIVKHLLVGFGLWHKPVILIGSGRTAKTIASFLEDDIYVGYKIVGIIGDNMLAPEYCDNPSLGYCADIVEIIQRSGVKDVIVAISGNSREKLLKLVCQIQLFVKNVSVVPEFWDMTNSNINVERLFTPRTLLFKIKNELLSPLKQCFKRLFDIVVCGTIAICSIPVFIVISILIRTDSNGPIIFSHKRIGHKGKTFPCFKFRTMIPDAEKVLEKYLAENPEAREEWEREFKLKHDPRITRIGQFLRKTSLDELPQMFNIMRGEMSLVGPRPIVAEEVPKYREYIQDYYMVRPGLTGLWQASGRNEVDYESRVLMDSWYVRNWSFWLDVTMLLKTVKVILERTGAY
jgi:Undecaprenyl-phosphate galactose phosphotransferase WbaP